MINDDFYIAGIRQVVAERLKRVVMYSMALGPSTASSWSLWRPVGM